VLRTKEDVMDKLLLTPQEAADVLGIGRSKLYQLMRTGTVASVHIGSCRRIPGASLPELVARLQAEAEYGSGASAIRRARPREGRGAASPKNQSAQ